MISQETALIDAFAFAGNYEHLSLSNNPYKLITGCFFEKTLTNEIIYGYTKIDKNWTINRLNPKTNVIQQASVNFEEIKSAIPAKVYDDLTYYGISGIVEGDKVMAINSSNTLLIFRKNGPAYTFQKEVTVNDSIEFNEVFPATDSTVILLDYKAKYVEYNYIKAYCLNIHTGFCSLVFKHKMGSNVACYDRTNTRYYDSNNRYFLITDNLDYQIYLFDTNMHELSTYNRKLNISDDSRKILNPKVLRANTHDSTMKELNLTPRIVNSQFLNDSEIVVNYATGKTIERDGLKIKSSMVDILVIRNNTLTPKRTLNDAFVYEKAGFGSTGKHDQKSFNPYLRGALPTYLFVGNQLVQFNLDAAIPKANMSYKKYIQKAKGSILNLKSNLIYSKYEYLN